MSEENTNTAEVAPAATREETKAEILAALNGTTEAPAPKPTGDKETAPAKIDSKTEWTNQLQERGKFTEPIVGWIVDYASTHHGYNLKHKWGYVLIRMINKLAQNMHDTVETFTKVDADNLVQKLCSFMMERPLGRNIIEWNSKFSDNVDQRQAVRHWAGVSKRKSEMSSAEKAVDGFIMAAWPSPKEELKGAGGSYAERLHYLVGAVVKLCTTRDDYIDTFFGPMLHDKPTDGFYAYINEIRRRKGLPPIQRDNGQSNEVRIPRWANPDGTCKSCGSKIKIDADTGVYVCENDICENSFPVVFTNTPESFSRPRDNATPVEVPQPAAEPRKSRQDRPHKKHDRHEDGEREFHKAHKKHHSHKFRPADAGDEAEGGHDDAATTTSPSGATVYQSPGSESFGNTAFAGLKLGS